MKEVIAAATSEHYGAAETGEVMRYAQAARDFRCD
jgi:hypothetical protein